MLRYLPYPLLIFLGFIHAGCSSTSETQQTVSPPPPIVVQPPPPKMEFETKTDTVVTEKSHLDSDGSRQSRELQVRYMVQIGAFKDPHYATNVQNVARERFHMPALNEYNMALALYQIRIGFFETREDANAFRKRLQQEYPRDYKDAWVVQLTR